MHHVVLVGDSTLDNGAYVRPDGDVLAKLQLRLPQGSRVSLLARDGAVIEGIRQQLRNVPPDTSCLVLSAGGNDALRSTAILMEPASSVADAFSKVLVVRNQFANRYRSLLDDVQALGVPSVICTIYDVMFAELTQRTIANLALGVLNDVITRAAAARKLPLIDLRVMFTREEHFANAIEPSQQGSALISAAIISAMTHDHSGAAAIYTGP